MKPLISVIIPCYNTAEYLPQCMESLEKQTIGLDKLQLIFVDDASTDGGATWEQILKFEKKHPNEVIALQLEENLSQGGAKNAGIEYAAGDYIGFVDSDDWLEPKMYQKLYECMVRYACDAVDCCVIKNYPGGVETVYHKKGDIFDRFEKSIMEGGEHWIGAFSHPQYGGGCVTGIYCKSLIVENHIQFPEHLKYEDNYWSAILKLYVKSYYHMQDNGYHYRQHGTSTVHTRNALHHLDQMEIEEKKLSTYQKLGIFERFHDEIERDFLKSYFCRTLLNIYGKYDIPLFDVFCRMTMRVRELFPDYSQNPYFKEDSIYKTLLKLIDKQLNEEQFLEIGNIIIKYYQNPEKMET